jgi:hypothetical protein
MTPRSTPTPGNTRRDQLTAALVVGGVVLALGAASGIGIGVASSASTTAAAPSRHQPMSSSSASRTPVNYVGVPGPGNIPSTPVLGVGGGGIGPGLGAGAAGGSSSAGEPGQPSTAGSATPTAPTTVTTTTTNEYCPPDVVTGLLDVLLGNRGLLGRNGLLRTVLNLLPNLTRLVQRIADAPMITTNLKLAQPQLDTMAQACTPVLSGLLGSSR